MSLRAARHCIVLFLAALLVPAAAGAAPADRVVSLREGGAVTLRISEAVRLHVDDPEVAVAEQLDSLEIRIEGAARGKTWLFLHGEAGLSVWQVRVSTPADPAEAREALARARQACPGLEATAREVTVPVGSAACHGAVLALGPHYEATALTIRFVQDGLRAQLAAQEASLAKALPDLAPRIQLAYLGATLRPAGRVPTVDDRDAVLRALWRASAGRFLVDLSRLEVEREREGEGEGGSDG